MKNNNVGVHVCPSFSQITFSRINHNILDYLLITLEYHPYEDIIFILMEVDGMVDMEVNSGGYAKLVGEQLQGYHRQMHHSLALVREVVEED